VAWRYGKPFAVVPCCVFAREFSHRRGPDDLPVNTYERLVDYLRAKPAVGDTTYNHFLPFLGRNQVLYSLPPPPPCVAEGVS